MIKRTIKIGRWVVDFLFATKGYDPDGALASLYDAGASEDVLSRARSLMESCEYNCGFTFGNQYRMRAVVMIGPASSGEEFQDTLVHEIHHLAVIIASNLGIDLEGEWPAYLSGDTMRELADVVCRLGCPDCH